MTTATTPGYKTSEFWLKILAFVLTALYASGVVPTSGPLAQAMAIGATILGALGYTVARTLLKTSAAKSPLIPAQVVEVPAKNPQSGRISVTLLALVAFLAVAACSLSMSCTAAQKKAVSNFGHCEETAAVKDLEGPIKSIGDQFIEGKLTKDSAMALLDSFAASYGLDTVGCAVTLVGQLFSSKVSGSADTGAATDLYNEWLAKHQKQAMRRMTTPTVAAASVAAPVTTITGAGLCIDASGVAEPCSHAFDSMTSGSLSASGVMTGDGAVATLPFVSNAQTLEYVAPASTFYGFEPQGTEVTADGHVYIWHFGSDGVATYTVVPTVKQ